jgi:esterase/lipase superfamily enzyme
MSHFRTLLVGFSLLASGCVAAGETPEPDEGIARATPVQVWYATDRARNDVADGAQYGTGRSHVTYGLARVSLPALHVAGRLEEPALASAGSAADQRWHVFLDSAWPLRRDDFVDNLQRALDTSERREILVYIHGFNNDFGRSVRRAAQIAADLEYTGVPLVFAWPSEGSVASYLADLNNADWAAPHLAELLRLAVEDLNADRINIIAHSMGGRLLIAALDELNRELGPSRSPVLGDVIFAAPDVDSEIFKTAIERLQPLAERFSLYVSSNDIALATSRYLAGDHPRAGESGKGMVVIADLDTIDASAVGDDLFGHEYFGESGPVLDDIRLLLQDGAGPGQRPHLNREFYLGRSYWRLAPQTAAGS